MPTTERQRAILLAVVESYIATGEPVSSGMLAREPLGATVSPATIRNELAALHDAGLLEQPHTSAGRIPTARAFRMYVDQLHHQSPPGSAAARLSAGSRSEIDARFAGVAGTQAVLERTSHVLATLSSSVGVAIAAAPDGDILEHVHFSRITPGRILAVVVTRSGLVRDRVLAIEHDLSASALETAGNFLNENFRGWSVEAVRAEIARLVDHERREYQAIADRIRTSVDRLNAADTLSSDRRLGPLDTLNSADLMHSVQELWQKTVPNTADRPQTAHQSVYVEGVANLVGMQIAPNPNASTSGPTASDRDRLRDMLAALETKQRLIDLLNAYIDARQQSVRVVFDLTDHAPEMSGLVLIAAPALMAGEVRGTVGVIGPKRMHYEQTMNAVGYIAQVFDRMLEP